MLALTGMAVVFLAVFGGFVLERGDLFVLLQPAELLIVGGAAVGITLIANPPAVIRKIWKDARAVFRKSPYSQEYFLRHLRMLYEVFAFVQRAGIMQLEADVEDPKNSRIFSNHPKFLRDTVTRDFVCDSLRMQVITMQAIGGSPETVGQKVAAALVGTFLGILLCYGVVGPAAARLASLSDSQAQFLQVLRIAIVAWARVSAPILAVEYARRSIPIELRPSFLEMETSIKRDAKVPPAPQLKGAVRNAAETAALA